MQTRPPGVPDDLVARAASEHWALPPVAAGYLPVGYGSHHWVLEAGPDRWFATVDVLSPTDRAESLATLSAALGTAVALAEHGLGFVVAPLPCRAGSPVVPLDGDHAMALYPYVDGVAGSFSDHLDAETADELCGMLGAVHAVPVTEVAGPRKESFTVPGADEVVAAVDEAAGGATWSGAYGEALARLLRVHGHAVRRALERQTRLVEKAGPQEGRLVVTHGEPHPGNVLRTEQGLRLIDWDTALLAPPERDVWLLDSRTGGHGGRAYTAATGRELRAELMEWYSLRWALADVTAFVQLLRGATAETEDTRWSWEALRRTLEDLSRG